MLLNQEILLILLSEFFQLLSGQLMSMVYIYFFLLDSMVKLFLCLVLHELCQFHEGILLNIDCQSVHLSAICDDNELL